jgi:hypothetical protein
MITGVKIDLPLVIRALSLRAAAGVEDQLWSGNGRIVDQAR